VQNWARRPARARDLGAQASTLAELLAQSSVLLVCVRDDALAEVVEQLTQAARDSGALRTRVVLHVAGAMPVSLLQPLARLGFAIGKLHPLLSLPRVSTKKPSRAIKRVAVADGARHNALPAHYVAQYSPNSSGARRALLARRQAKSIVSALAGQYCELAPKHEADYHLAASLVANGALALFAAAQVHMQAAGVPKRAYAALLESVAHNLDRFTPAQAQTGPIARGDAATVARHWQRLGARHRSLYRALAEVLLELSNATRTEKQRMARVLARKRRK
jgi:predicted short-subunit dehydrogenase-like oxidoreductase (DUF2520 family)